MGERVTISYRGAAYELGRGKHSYGIWAVGTPRAEPVERWPETPEGWNAAWSRFTAIESPGTIAAARAPGGTLPVSASAGAAAALLGIGILCGIVSLFPGYLGGASLASQPPQLVPHVIYLAAWTLSAVLILLGGSRLRAGALFGLGTSIVTFGLFFADLGEVIAGGAHLADAGLWFGLVGWLACAAGSAVACWLGIGQAAKNRRVASRTAEAAPAAPAAAPGAGGAAPGAPAAAPGAGAPAPGAGPATGAAAADASIGGPGLLRGYEVGRAVLLILAGIGAAVAFAPSWDSYLLHTATGTSQTVTAGFAFSNPGAVIAGDLAVMIGFGLLVIVAAVWRPVRMGAMLLAGAVIPMAAQAISAVVQVGEATPSTQFGISQSQASAIGLTISNGLTASFWIFSLLIVVLVVSCAWMLITPPAPAVVPSQMPKTPYDRDGSHDPYTTANGTARDAADADGAWDSDAEAGQITEAHPVAERPDGAEAHPVAERPDGAEAHDGAERHDVAKPDDAADSVDFGRPGH